VLSPLEQVLYLIEAARQESREMNEVARQEAREMNDASRLEAREESRTIRQETLQLEEAARKESRTFFLALVAIGAAIMGTVIGTSLAG
jgi:vacuolar-type H+-ATPase subunit H